MAGSSLFTNLARGAKVLALLLFLMPWVTVSCSPNAMQQAQSSAGEGAPRLNMPNSGLGDGVPIANASGLNMALGQLNMLTPNTGPRAGGDEQANPPRTPEVPMEIGVIAGAALILLALFGSFLKGTAGALTGLGSCVLAIGALCYSVFISYPPAVRTALATSNPSGASGGSAPTPEQIEQILAVKTEMIFYLVLLVLALAVLFNFMAMRKTGVAPAAVAAQPPAEPPAGV